MSQHADADRNIVVELQIKHMTVAAPGKHVTIKASSADVTDDYIVARL
jgi:predicted thioesterase